jgi:hypothetical protein
MSIQFTFAGSYFAMSESQSVNSSSSNDSESYRINRIFAAPDAPFGTLRVPGGVPDGL